MRAKRAVDFLGWGSTVLVPLLQGLLRSVENRLEEVDPYPTHLDLKPDHIFFTPSQVTLIDLDSFVGADPVLDVATLVARLQVMPRLCDVGAHRIDDAIGELLEIYFRTAPRTWRRRFSVGYACAALKVALYFLQHLEPEWEQSVSDILHATERIMRSDVPVPVLAP